MTTLIEPTKCCNPACGGTATNIAALAETSLAEPLCQFCQGVMLHRVKQICEASAEAIAQFQRRVCGVTEPCPMSDSEAYRQGHAAAHAELREHAHGDHAEDCDCEPCQTIRVVMDSYSVHSGP